MWFVVNKAKKELIPQNIYFAISLCKTFLDTGAATYKAIPGPLSEAYPLE